MAENNKLGQEPVFPATTDHMIDQLVKNNQSPEGISKRLYIATKIVAAKVSKGNFPPAHKFTVEDAYRYADELLKQENE